MTKKKNSTDNSIDSTENTNNSNITDTTKGSDNNDSLDTSDRIDRKDNNEISNNKEITTNKKSRLFLSHTYRLLFSFWFILAFWFMPASGLIDRIPDLRANDPVELVTYIKQFASQKDAQKLYSLLTPVQQSFLSKAGQIKFNKKSEKNTEPNSKKKRASIEQNEILSSVEILAYYLTNIDDHKNIFYQFAFCPDFTFITGDTQQTKPIRQYLTGKEYLFYYCHGHEPAVLVRWEDSQWLLDILTW